MIDPPVKPLAKGRILSFAIPKIKTGCGSRSQKV